MRQGPHLQCNGFGVIIVREGRGAAEEMAGRRHADNQMVL